MRAYARAHIRLGRIEQAIELFEKLYTALPKDPDILNALAYAYDMQGDKRALEYAARAYKLAPEQASVLDTYGWLLTRNGQPAKALKHLRKARLLAPAAAEVRYHLGVTLHQLDRDDEAVSELRGALHKSTGFEGAAQAAALLNKLAPG